MSERSPPRLSEGERGISWQEALKRLHHSDVSEARKWGLSSDSSDFCRDIILDAHAEMVEALKATEAYLDSYIDELAAADIHAAYSKNMLAVVRSALNKACPAKERE